MTEFIFGDSSAPDSHRLSGQTIDANVILNDTVYHLNGTWFKAVASGNILKLPTGVFIGANTVVLDGVFKITGLVAGRTYYWDEVNGTITLSKNRVKLGKAISTTLFLLDIDTRDPSAINSLYGYTRLKDNGPTGISTINKLTFSTDENVSITAVGGVINQNMPSAFSSDIHGFIVGSDSVTIEKVDFSNDSVANHSSNLTQRLEEPAATSSPTAGYTLGGSNTVTPAAVVGTIDKLVFNGGDTSVISATLVTSTSGASSAKNDSFGYVFAGSLNVVPDATNLTTLLQKLQFSNENVTSITNVPNSLARMGAFSNNLFAYILGGQSGTSISISRISALDFSNDISRNIFLNLGASRSHVASFQSGTAGYVSGGNTALVPDVQTSTIEKLDFIVNNIVSISTTLTTNASHNAGFDN